AALAEMPDVEKEADRILKQMSDYLDGLNKFSITSHSTIESVLDSGQKIMFDHYNTGAISRPDKLYFTRKGDAVDQSFYYDGKSFSMLSHPENLYATVDAPANISDTLTWAINQFDLTAPGADLIGKDSYDKLSNELISGFYVGKGIVDGVECHHLAFRNTEVDWQVWIQTGDQPLPKRYVVTSRWTTGSPQFNLEMTWNTQPDFSDDVFKFTAPEKAEKIELLSNTVSH
ncbi:MAG: DUF2092 domain-containing protein, partial [Pseudomonadota bacterium]|nr:DUF2092 domain-containing protein [Pseudomonadota bacterium]